MEQTHSPVDDEAVEAFIELWRDTGDKKTAIHKRCLFDLNYHRAAEEAQGRIRWRRPNTRPQKKYPNNQNSLPAARMRPTFQPKHQKTKLPKKGPRPSRPKSAPSATSLKPPRWIQLR